MYCTSVSSALNGQMPAFATLERSWKPASVLCSITAPCVVSTLMPSPAMLRMVFPAITTPVLGVHGPRPLVS